MSHLRDTPYFILAVSVLCVFIWHSFLATAHAASTTCTDAYTKDVTVPTGYGASYNLFSSAKEQLVKTASCTDTRASITVGNGDAATYVYKLGYQWTGSTWQQVSFTGSSALVSNLWYIGTANGTFTLASGNTSKYYVGYTCQKIGDIWKCGCRDATCVTPYWQLQKVDKVTTGNSAPVCGNNICESGETASNCAQDCTGNNNQCRKAWEWPCSAESYWNLPFGSGAQYSSKSDPRVASLNKHNRLGLNTVSWGVAVYKGETSHPDITLKPSTSYSSYVWNGKNVIVKGPAGMQLPYAAGKTYDLDDGFINIIQPDDQTNYETSFAEKPASNATTIKTGPVFKWDIRGSCRADNGFNGGYMAGPTMAGMIRKWEMEGNNEVRHALLVGVCTDQLKKGYIWPATFEDNFASSYSGAIPIGTMFAIPPSVDIESLGLNQYGKKIGYALQRYGMIVSLQGCGPVMVGEPALEGGGIASAIRSDLSKLLKQTVVVTNTTQSTPKGGGTPIVSKAPGFCAP